MAYLLERSYVFIIIMNAAKLEYKNKINYVIASFNHCSISQAHIQQNIMLSCFEGESNGHGHISALLMAILAF